MKKNFEAKVEVKDLHKDGRNYLVIETKTYDEEKFETSKAYEISKLNQENVENFLNQLHELQKLNYKINF